MKKPHHAKGGGGLGVHRRDWIEQGLKELDLCRFRSLTTTIIEGNFVNSIAVDNDEIVV
jgi:hypothetical protein